MIDARCCVIVAGAQLAIERFSVANQLNDATFDESPVRTWGSCRQGMFGESMQIPFDYLGSGLGQLKIRIGP